jgi:hypothetical protein
MNKRNLNEGQWEDRKQWSLGDGQRRKTFWNRYINTHTYIHTYTHTHMLICILGSHQWLRVFRLRSRSISVWGTTIRSVLMKLHLKLACSME